MAFGVTEDGFVIKPLATIVSEIEDDQRADIDPGLDLDARSAQGMLNQIFGGALAELWELAEATYNAAYPDSANDASLDNVASITGTSRDATTKTTVEGVSVTLNPNKSLPAGSVAHLTSQPNARFVSDAEVPADTVGGVFTVDFTAETAGAITVEIGQLAVIAEPVSGWVVVNNTIAGVTGDETESDSELRIRRLAELEGGGSTNVNSIRANLLQVDGVDDASVFENDSDIVDASGLSPHSIRAVVRGGDAADIAQSIFDTKAAGINTNGTVVTAVTDSQGNDHTIRHDTTTDLNYFMDATVTVDTTFDTVNGVTDMETAVKTYIDELPIGGDVIRNQVERALLGVTGTVDVTVFAHDFTASPVTTVNLTVAEDEKAISDVANLDITTASA